MIGESSDPSFNLVSEPWVPVVTRNGTTQVLSLRDLFRHAPDVQEVVGDIPQQVLPIVRLCESILYRAYGRDLDADALTEPDARALWQALWDACSFADGAVDDYLTEFEDRFDLFGERPFMQVAGLSYVSRDKEYDPVSELLADVPKQGKFLFSMRARDALGGISYAEAARWLLFFQAYDCAGIKTPVIGNTHVNKGKVYAPKGLPSTGWLGSTGGTYLEGQSLFETLLLNWVLYNEYDKDKRLLGCPSDVPAWETEETDRDYEVRNPQGPAQLYAWQSRRIRLVPDVAGGAVVGVVSCYGDIPRPTELPGFEQMTPWRESIAQQKALGTTFIPRMPRTHDSSKAIWRGLESILSRGDASAADLRPGVVQWIELLRASGLHGLPDEVGVHAQGVEYGSQSSVMTQAMDDRVDLGSALLRKDSPAVSGTVEVVSLTDKAVYQLVVLVRSVERSQGSMLRDKDPQGQRVADDVRERAYSELDELFRSRIAGFSEEEPVEEYCSRWLDEVHRMLLSMSQAYLSSSAVSYFDRRATGSVAEAESKYRWQLTKILGPIAGKARLKEEGAHE